MENSPVFFNPKFCRNEAEVESKFIVHFLLPRLGYSPETWRQEVTVGKIRLDFLATMPIILAHRSHSSLVIEAKHPKQNLDAHLRKFRHYLIQLQAHYGLITNGREVRIYQAIEADLVLRLQMPGPDVPKRFEEIRALIGRELPPVQARPPFSPHSAAPASQLHNLKPVSAPEQTMKTIAIYHNKGGVGKTTTVINLAAALSRKNHRVLVIDLDSQANTTYAAGLVKFQDEADDTIRSNYIYHVILEKNKYPIREVAQASEFTQPGFDVVPSHIDLMEHENELIQVPAALTRLVKKLAEAQPYYDIVLIDTPPSLNLYARIALIAADYLLIPSDLKPFANEGLKNVQRFVGDVNEFRDSIGKEPIGILGVLPAKINTADKFVKHTLPRMEALVQKQYGFSLLKSRIFERRDVSAAIERTIEVGDLDVPSPISIFDHKPYSQSAEEFESLANEVLSLIKS
jgi:chromosome partitioning protein